MKKKLFLILFLIVILSISLVLFTGCGKSKVEENNTDAIQNNVDNSQEDGQVETEDTTPKDPNQVITDAWFKLPENLDYYLENEYSNGTTSIQHFHKRGKNILLELQGHYYFYKYKGDYIWTSNEYIEGKGWDNFYFNGNIVTVSGSCEALMLTKLDEYTTEHEKFTVEGVGEVDTVIGKDGDNTYYYSKELDLNVKTVTTNITSVLTKYDKNVTDYPHSIPDNI